MTRMSFFAISLLLFITACVEGQESATINLNPDPSSKIFYLNQNQEFSGTVTGNISEVSVVVDGSVVEDLVVENSKFSFNYSFDRAAVLNLTLIGKDGEAKVQLEKKFNLIVRDNVPPTGDDPLANDQFDFPEPHSRGAKLTLWATYYYLPQLINGSGTYALRDMQGKPLGPVLSHRGWCDSAMEGSVRVLFDNGEAHTYNYAGTSSGNTVDCKKFFRHDVSRSKFKMARGPYGDGIRNYILSPYRTIATDSSVIAPGTVIFIPKARGTVIVTDEGREIVHDGYFFAGDRGGAIKGTHIDVFIGTHTKAPFFSWIGSSASKTFEAFVITDQAIISQLADQHIQ